MLTKYSKLHVNMIAGIIATILFIIIIYAITNSSNAYDDTGHGVLAAHIETNINSEMNEYIPDVVEVEETVNVWQVKIPKINLIGPIHSRNY